MNDFSNKSILVTGSTRGIGFSIDSHLLERGATVGIHGRSEESVAEASQKLNSPRIIPVDATWPRPSRGASWLNALLSRQVALTVL